MEPRFKIESSLKGSLKISVTINGIFGFRTIMGKISQILNLSRNYNVTIIWRNLPADLRYQAELVSLIESLFGFQGRKCEIIAESVRNHMYEYGKYPDVNNKERMYNYIKSVSNKHNLDNEELENIRSAIMLPVLS